MPTDHKAFAKEVDGRAVALFKAAPETMRAYRGLMETVAKDGALDARTKELMAVCVSIVTRCPGCISYHLRQAQRRGATREQVVETIAVAVEMGGGPATVYGGEALEAYDQLFSE